MRRLASKIVFIFLFLTFGDVYGTNDNRDALSVGVVDLKRVQNESKAMSSVRAQADKLRQVYQEEVAKLEDQLRKDSVLPARPYNVEEGSLNSEEKLEKKYKDLYKLSRIRKYQWENAVREANAQFSQKMNEIVDKIAKAEKITIVINKEAIMYSQKEIDITERVITILDEEMPHIDVIPTAKEKIEKTGEL